jgi:soluble lytic murein transglycosylase-like protein
VRGFLASAGELLSGGVRMLSLRAYLAFGLLSVTAAPATTFAWDQPAGSPPGWHPQWVQTVEKTQLFDAATDDVVVGLAPQNTFYRMDAPVLAGRLWVYNPLNEGWAWLPGASTTKVDEPTLDQVITSGGQANPRDYLYARAPDLAPRLDCIIRGESGWDPRSRNPRSGAAGLAQFLPSTWATTPQGQSGLSPYDPLDSIDAAIWLARTRGWTQWQVYTVGNCH